MLLGNKEIKCSGCAACANICPVKAISMIENEDGFYVPFINQEKCTKCGLCERTCPQCNEVIKNNKNPDCYAVMADDAIRATSSSGGAFTRISEEVFNRGGVVCGAAFDENWTVKHIIIDNPDDMKKLRGSKYVQSFISETLYREIKSYLEAGRWVLFSGVPCQVSGLKKYLGKDYDTLLTVDIICSKVPPKKLFDKFLKDTYGDGEITDIKFRDKNNGWNCSTTTITVDGVEQKSRMWFRMYLNSLSMNESCVHCKYMSVDRISDITIGDFWGIERVRPDLNDKKGTSCVLLNTAKGRMIFEKLNWVTKAKMTTKNAVDGNRALCVPFIPHQNRTLFGARLDKNNFSELVENSLSNDFNVGILNWWWNSNRGAILTCYAIQEVVKDLGFNPSVIKHIPFNYYHDVYNGSISEKFAEKYLNLTDWCHSRIDMRRLNEKFETFMVGSDQVWRHSLNWFLQDFYYLNFANIKKNLVSCAASFGVPEFSVNDTVVSMVKYYFSRFNHISVREEDAVALLKDKFDADGTFILDPVFLIGSDKYSKIADTCTNKTSEPFVAYYFIQPNKDKSNIVKSVANKLGIKAIDIKAEGLAVEDWLYYIKNAEIVISDSFHASSFSVIFNTKFFTIFNSKNDSRFNTLANISGLNQRFIRGKDFELAMLDDFMQDEDWGEIANKFKPLQEFSISWLRNALENSGNKVITQEQEYLEAMYASMDDRLNYLEGVVQEMKNNRLSSNKFSFKNSSKYYGYRILCNFTFGKLRDKMLAKKNKYKNLLSL